MAGALTYQSAGLLAGSGALAQMYNYGSAAAGLRSGGISPELASLMGGQSGMAQSMTQAQGAMMNSVGSLLAAASLRKNPDGSLDLNLGTLSNLASGKMDYQSILQRAVGNLSDAGTMGQFQMQHGELLAGVTTSTASRNDGLSVRNFSEEAVWTIYAGAGLRNI